MALKRRAFAAAACTGAVLAAAGCGGGGSPRSAFAPGGAAAPPTGATADHGGFYGVLVPDATTAAPFSLRDQNGERISLVGERGKLVLLSFLYTHCRDVCPLVAEHLSDAVRMLGHQSSAVDIVAVTVDPEYDTPAVVRAFVRAHGLVPQFHWLLGTRNQLAPVWQGYNILVDVHGVDVVSHAAPVFLIDRSGRARVYYESTASAAGIAGDLRKLLRTT
jgi:protein SCO1/2